MAVFSAGAWAAEVEALVTTSCVPGAKSPSSTLPFTRRAASLATPRQPVLGPTKTRGGVASRDRKYACQRWTIGAVKGLAR